jgi:GT2 family glycosyltransferase
MVNWVLMPVRNNLHLTRAAIKSILKQDMPDVKVLMINNDSQDSTAAWARTMYPSVVTLNMKPALSVARSWNKGLTLLFEGEGAEYVLVVNNDVELRPETYRLLVGSGYDFVTAVGNGDPRCTKVTMPDAYPPWTPRPNPDFSCFLLRRWVWDKVGGFDENYKGAFCEDWDYHVRLQKAGIKAVCIDVPFYHVGSATINNMSPEDREKLCKQADLNREYFKNKWGVAGGSPEYYALFE